MLGISNESIATLKDNKMEMKYDDSNHGLGAAFEKLRVMSVERTNREKGVGYEKLLFLFRTELKLSDRITVSAHVST